MEAQPVDNEEFQRYVATMKERTDVIDKLCKDDKLKLYSLGRQGQDGDNNTPKPGMLAIKDKVKWSAWNKLKGTNQEDAKRQFLAFAKQVLGETQ